jgi:hypothetical protein
VLRLSSQWFFNDVRQRAIASIEAIDIPLLERIEMAKEHHVSAWLLAGYRKLALRNETITVEEAEKVDLRKAILVCGLREKYKGRGYCESEVDKAILTTFASDFDKVHAMEAQYPAKEERKVMEAERVKARAEEKAMVLARRESMIEEARRQAAIEEYDRQLEEQRANLLRLEREKEQMLNGNTACGLFTAPFSGLQTNPPMHRNAIQLQPPARRRNPRRVPGPFLRRRQATAEFQSTSDSRIDIVVCSTPISLDVCTSCSRRIKSDLSKNLTSFKLNSDKVRDARPRHLSGN